MSPAVWALLGLLCVFSVVSLVVSLVIFSKVNGVLPHVTQAAGVFRDVQQLKLVTAEITDRVLHWQKRDRVRRLREGQEAAAEREAADDDRDSDDFATVSDVRDIKRQLREAAGI